MNEPHPDPLPAEPVSVRIDPEGLFRLMALVSGALLLLILSLSAYGAYRALTWHIIQTAEDDAADLSELILASEGKLLLGKTGHRDLLAITAKNRDRLNRRFRSLLTPFDIIRIKLYDLNRKIVYSTDPAFVGKVDDANPLLGDALAGNGGSRLEREVTLGDLTEEKKLDIDVVESYVPIRHDQQIIGCLELHRDVTRYREKIRHGAQAVVGILGAVLLPVFGAALLVTRKGAKQLRAAREELKLLASTDPLTGIFNRGEILARARKETSRLRRAVKRTPDNAIGLVLLDLDRFKLINDRYGYSTGDLVLRQLTRRIKLELRDYDLFGRFGGEEFLAVLPATKLSSALVVAERMLRAVSETPFDIGGKNISVTASLGIAEIAGDALDLTGALQQADEALSRAKTGGRNRVCCADSP